MPEHYLKPVLKKTTFIARLFGNVRTPIRMIVLFMTFLMPCLLNAQCPSAPGDPAIFGSNAWNAYVYDNNDLSLTTTVYSGYYTQGTLGFDSMNSWNPNSSPANVEGWPGCTVNNDAFTYVYKRKGFPCGSYTITMTGWDDAAILFIDGVAQWSCSDSSDNGNCDGYIGEIVLNEDTEFEVRIREDGGDSFASLSLVNNTPTVAGSLTPSGNTTICAGTMPEAITLLGHIGDIAKWQSAEDVAFTIAVTDIPSSSTELTSLDMGAITTTHYYRAVVQNGTCNPAYTTPVQITVPAPVTYSDGAWDGIPTETTSITIADDMTLIDDLEVCSCQVTNGKTLTIGSDVSLTVAGSVTVDSGSQLIIEDKGSLVQLDDLAVNSGSIKVKRNSQPMKLYDYTYWSSPVQNNTLYQLSPLTLSDKYFKYNPIIDNWVLIAGGNEVMEAGRGYIIRAPQGWSVNNESSGVYNAEFNGIANNGVIPATIQKGAGISNLIGNPYPSAIDIDLFLTDPDNVGIVDGTISLWTHNTAIAASVAGNWTYTVDDYAKYNLTGGVSTADAAISGGNVPDGKIASGQGFFIDAGSGLANGTYTANFKNYMRIGGSNDQFYRSVKTNVASLSAFEKSRIWLNISNAQGAYSQILIGYITNATNGVDALFDGKQMESSNVLSMYSIIGTDTYSIQGRALPFTANDVVQLGYKSTISGNFTIAINDFDGLFDNQDVYLIDRLNNVEQNLKVAPYSFTSGTGVFNDRFEIRYAGTALGIPDFNENSVLLTVKDKQLTVQAQSSIESIQLFDLLGRKVYEKNNINALHDTSSQLQLSGQMFVVKIKLTNFEITRKIVLE